MSALLCTPIWFARPLRTWGHPPISPLRKAGPRYWPLSAEVVWQRRILPSWTSASPALPQSFPLSRPLTKRVWKRSFAGPTRLTLRYLSSLCGWTISFPNRKVIGPDLLPPIRSTASSSKTPVAGNFPASSSPRCSGCPPSCGWGPPHGEDGKIFGKGY